MRWKIGECEFDAITRVIRPVSTPPLGEPDARLLEILIERYGIKRKHSAKVENQQLEREVWGDKGSDDNLYKSAEHLRAAFGEERRSYILSKPVRLAVKPELIPDDELSNSKGAFLDVPSAPKRDYPKQLATSVSPKLDLSPNLNRSNHPSWISAIGNQPTDDAQEWTEFIHEVSRPEENAVRFAEKFNATDSRIIGPVIEVFGHPFLDSNLALAEAGWSPDQVRLVDGGELDTSAVASDPRVEAAFNGAEAIRAVEGKGTALELPNNGKYAIADTSSPFHDITNLTLTFKRTDYFSILRSRPAVSGFLDVWMKYGHVHPSGNQIPQAAAIQFSAIFGGREILAIHRDKYSFPFPDTWSFSGEEQFDRSDFQWDEPDRMKYAMLRTAQEEIFPLARIYDKAKLLKVIEIVEPYIRSMRIWSMFLEGPTATYSVFCVYEFDFRMDEYADLVRGLVRRGLGQTSREGKYFSVNLADVPTLLKGDAVPARPIFGGEPVLIPPEKFHPTSQYRLVRLLNVLHNQS